MFNRVHSTFEEGGIKATIEEETDFMYQLFVDFTFPHPREKLFTLFDHKIMDPKAEAKLITQMATYAIRYTFDPHATLHDYTFRHSRETISCPELIFRFSTYNAKITDELKDVLRKLYATMSVNMIMRHLYDNRRGMFPTSFGDENI